MTTDFALWKAIFRMPSSLKAELLNYAEYLLAKQTQQASAESDQQYGLGCWSGKVSMAADFDAPLDDMKDYM